MTFVVDIGCADWGTETSVEKLVERFRPRYLYGFDPAPAMAYREGYANGDTFVVVQRKAAATFDGRVVLYGSGTRATTVLGREPDGPANVVECFDLAAYMAELAEPAVLKLDCEGSEYGLLRHLLGSEAALAKLERVLVEWHDPDKGRAELVTRLSEHGVEVEDWA